MTETTGFWDGRTVMVTGGTGFLGSHLVEDLRGRSENAQIFIPRSDQYDLREKADIKQAFEDSEADTVIHLAATVGGIGANKENPGQYFYDNAIMGIELIEQA
jgi:dTDP-glucose 4,6-dehydratase/GDP-L-fucose synthase